jgi:hypothetical protein
MKSSPDEGREMLPFEDKARQEVEADHHKELAESRELLRLALDMIGSDDQGNLQIPSEPVPGVTDRARSLALGLYAKACKQFRGIIILGERGFGGEATVLTRSLFETTLALNFIMKESIALKRGGKDFDPDTSRPLTTDFRALLYCAYAAFMEAKRYRQWSERPELNSVMGLRGDPKVIAAQTAAAKAAVGENWWDAFKVGQAGLKIRDLADSLGVLSYYLTIYGDQSEVAHAGDGYMHFDVEDDGAHGSLDLSPSPAGIGGLLRLACLVFLGCPTGIHNRLKFGDAVDKTLDAFAAQLGVPSDK